MAFGFFRKLAGFFSGYKEIDEDFYEELEETLVMGDIGIFTTERLISELRKKVQEKKISDPEECRELLKDSIKEALRETAGDEDLYAYEKGPAVILVVGVNGVGKTTTIGKLAAIYKEQGKKVLLSAADTFRAAAIDQLAAWAERADVDIVKGLEGGDPGAVIFDSIRAAKARKADLLICDTAGRLHNKKNLMNELKKINTIINSEYPEAMKETWVVVDGTTGQNALSQAKEFMEATGVTGLILTKLDGSAKGGIAIAIQNELKIPLKFIGLGEKLHDLVKFDPDSFVEELFRTGEKAPEAETEVTEETAEEETEAAEEVISEETAEPEMIEEIPEAAEESAEPEMTEVIPEETEEPAEPEKTEEIPEAAEEPAEAETTEVIPEETEEPAEPEKTEEITEITEEPTEAETAEKIPEAAEEPAEEIPEAAEEPAEPETTEVIPEAAEEPETEGEVSGETEEESGKDTDQKEETESKKKVPFWRRLFR